MAKAYDKPPEPIVEKGKDGRLVPVDAYFAQMIDEAPVGAQFDLIRRGKRSNKQNSYYWAGLAQAIAATGNWPTPSHLHDELKDFCGFKRSYADWKTGEIREILDSTAFDRMTQDEFNHYFETVSVALIENVGFDPWAELEHLKPKGLSRGER